MAKILVRPFKFVEVSNRMQPAELLQILKSDTTTYKINPLILAGKEDRKDSSLAWGIDLQFEH